ncbi:phosphatase PAP2 family protein [Maribacter algicola]|uniref:Phosphatase PAP2 family protein n=1 Tax=Maribacter algicola TaxID=2498892 RepID=A0A3R8S0Z6_9FLAO|nr:phosphatase PAP2 family protein [Maribacter algicola]RRQ49595.1 phosphatase PAP2 family protein [Maribacter algicola]
MKTKYIFFGAIMVLILANSCEKDIPRYTEFKSYAYANNDENGGNWVSILLDGATAVDIAPPETTTSTAYLAEIADIKSKMDNINDNQRKSIEYWTNNAVVRWNEIALELIAKYNLIPGPNDDDTYTLPNPNTPDGPPGFPFSHPPYASRALAYLSVAQFDGLISAWHYKYEYNRRAPYQNDASISYAYEPNDIPSYPSDGAVLARISKNILSTMFPLEVAYLEKMEKEHLESLLLSGSNVQSDIDAGVIIANTVSEIALERAANDGMKNAQAPKSVSDSIKAAAFERFGWQWENLELPVRPVGLTPLFGKVKMWSIDDVESVRPIPPPSLDSQEYRDDVEILKNYADNMTDEYRAIANFWQDGLGTYTPPGHWNRFANEFIVESKMNPLRSARTMAYMNMAIMDAGISCWDAKYYYHYPRPIQTIPGFRTIAGTPNFPSYTSGHSVFSAAASEVLAYIFPEKAGLVRGWAEEAAISRVYGGIHWTFDATVGTDQGRNVAQYTINVARMDGAD